MGQAGGAERGRLAWSVAREPGGWTSPEFLENGHFSTLDILD